MNVSHIRPILRALADRRLWTLLLSICVATSSQAEEAQEKESPEFVRIQKNDDDRPTMLQTAIARYVAADGRDLQIDLIGAVHIGEGSYYEELNEQFKKYDALLYELVAPEGTRIPQGAKGTGSAVGGLQSGMKDMLELEFQLEKIDYSPENFVHADMTPEEFAQDMRDSGDSFLHMFARAMGQGLVQQSKGKTSDTALMMAMFSKDRALKMRQIFASQIEEMDGQMRAIEGPNGSTLISRRNAKAFEVLADQIKQGRKRIGVFYGAGHLDDMHKRLVDEFNMKFDSIEYLDAWNLQSTE